MVYERQLDALDRWLRETGDGFQAIHFLSDGTQIPYLEKNPGKAADLLIRMAEHFVPKLNRTELTGKDGAPLRAVFRIEEPE
jgi:hypothetical protein